MSVAPSLEVLIQELRDEIRDETPLRIHARAVPILRDFDGVTDRRNADEGGTGLPFSAAMHRYLGHPDGWGTTRLGMASILEVSEACASRHPTHRRPLFQRTVCSQLLFEIGYLGQSIEDSAWLHGLQRIQVEGLLRWALPHAAAWRRERFIRLTREPGHETPLPERKRVA